MFFDELRQQIESNTCPDVTRTVNDIQRSKFVNSLNTNNGFHYAYIHEYKIKRKDNSNKWNISFYDKKIGSSISISYNDYRLDRNSYGVIIPYELFTEQIWKDLLKIKNKNYKVAGKYLLYLNKLLEIENRKNKINEDF